MQIIIPMTGYGSRFVAAGYKDLKPLIRIEDKPIIEWIVKGMYPGETNFIFVCRKEHIDTIHGMKEELHRISPSSRIYMIDDWVKRGPVYDVLRASDAIDDEAPAIIQYCDFYMSWDWKEFKRRLTSRNPDGCVPCFTGFHPNLMVSKNFYASCLTDEEDNLLEIREKYSFEKDKTKAKHSAGNYYFKNGEILKKYCQALVDSGQTLNGEYYASMPFNFMVKDDLKVWIPTDIDYFCAWGTPEEMKESIYWINMMKDLKR